MRQIACASRRLRLFPLILIPVALISGCGGEGTSPEVPPGTPPVIESFRPLEGQEGDSVTIFGNHFDLSPAATAVTFGSIAGEIQSTSATELCTAVPAGAVTGPLGISTSGGSAQSDLFFIVIDGSGPVPQIVNVEPTAGPVGTPVTIEGTGFDPRPPANHVSFNGILAEVSSASEGMLVTAVPPGASAGALSVTTSGGRTSAPNFFTVGTVQDSCGNPTFVSGIISSAANWTSAGCPYVILEGVTVAPGVRLTIEAGVVIKLMGAGTRLRIEGELLAQGTPTAPVVFTSYRDDTHAGDTNGDGSASAPAPGNWATVGFRAGSSGTLANVEFYYGGASGEGGLLLSSAVTVEQCTFGRNAFWGLTAPDHHAGLDIVECTFFGNDRPLLIHPGLSLGTGNSFSAAGEPPNTENAVFFTPGTTPPGDIFWEETEVSYVFMPEEDDDNNIFVAEGSSLHISPGVTLKLWGEPADLVVFGELEALGESGNPIIVTSYRDDSHGGDSNGDGAATSPGKGDWDAIDLCGGSRSIIHHVHVLYGGARARWTEGELVAYAGSFGDIRNCEFMYSPASGIALFGGGGRIADCYFYGCDQWGVRCASGDAWYWWGGNALRLDNAFASCQEGHVRIFTAE